MDLLQAIERAEQNINLAYKHPNYKRTVDLKKLYLQVLTGEDIDDLLPQFELREDKNLFKQRRALTIENLTPTISPVCDKFYGVARIQPSKTVLAQKAEKQKFIEAVESSFYNRQDIEAYMDDILDEIAISDPNAFLAIGFEPFNEGETPKVYPTVFGCEEVFDFVYKSDGALDFLFVCQEVEIRGKHQTGRTVKNKRVYDYYCISEGNALIYREITEGRVLNDGGTVWVSDNGKSYQKKEIFVGSDSTETPETPALRLGYIQHKKHRAICISPIHPAIPILRDMIRDKSEYDVSKRCHVFPQKIMYDDVCKGEVHIDESRRCINGYISGTQDTCSVCQGSGFRPHKSGQEVIRIKRPLLKEEFLPIDQIVTYVTTNLEAVKMLSDDMERNAVKVESAVFSSGMRQRSNMRTGQQQQEMPTATQMVISTDDYNYVLDAWAKNRSRWFCFIVRQIGEVFDTGVDVTFKYSGKYVMETQEELINRLKSLADAGVSIQLINEADLRIAKVFFDNDEIGMKRYITRAMFEPFRGRGADALTLLENENVRKSTKVLFANFDQIFERIERENGVEFYDKKPSEQKVIIDKIVDEIKGELEKEQPAMMLGLPKTLGTGNPKTSDPAGDPNQPPTQ